MAKYYLDKKYQEGESFPLVHEENCKYLSGTNSKDSQYIGDYNEAFIALRYARDTYTDKAQLCNICCR